MKTLFVCLFFCLGGEFYITISAQNVALFGSACQVASSKPCDVVVKSFRLTSDSALYQHQFGALMLTPDIDAVQGLNGRACVTFGKAKPGNQQSLSIWFQQDSLLMTSTNPCEQTPRPNYPYANNIGNYIEFRFVSVADDPAAAQFDRFQVYTRKNGVSAQLADKIIPFDLSKNGNSPLSFRIVYDDVISFLQIYLDDVLLFEQCKFNLHQTVFDPNTAFWIVTTGQTIEPVLQQVGAFNAHVSFCKRKNCDLAETFEDWIQTGPQSPTNLVQWQADLLNGRLWMPQNKDLSFFQKGCGEWINGRFKCRIKTGALGQGNLFGLVFGWTGTDCANPMLNQGWMFGWRASAGVRAGVSAAPGMYLAHADGNMPDGAGLGERIYHVWGNQPGPKWKSYPILANNIAWQPNSTYLLELEYTSEHIKLWVDGVLYFQISRPNGAQPFEAGKIGFFTYDQSDISFFDAQYIHSDDIENPAKYVCPNEAHPWHMLLPYGDAHLNGINWQCRNSQSIVVYSGTQGKGQMQDSVPIQVKEPGMYTLIALLNTTFGCDLKQTDTFNVPYVPQLQLLPGDTIYCWKQPLDINVFNHQHPDWIYEWSNGKKGPVIVIDTPMVLSLKAFQPDSICPIKDTLRFDMWPQADIVLKTQATCEDLQPEGVVDGSVLNGKSPFSFEINGQKVKKLPFDGLAAGHHELWVIDSVGCRYPNKFVIEEKQRPRFDISIHHARCFGAKDGQIHFDNATPGTQFSLNDGPFTTQTDYDHLGAGEYRIVYKIYDYCLYDTTVQIESPPPFHASITPRDTSIEAGIPIRLRASVEHTDFQGKLSWTGDGLSCNTCFMPFVTICKTTNYALVATDQYGCTAAATAIVDVIAQDSVYVPNVFSPNGDGENERLILFATDNIAEIGSWQIFSRKGDLVFEQKNFPPNDPEYGWDGTFKGKKMPMGVYVYKVEGIRLAGACGMIALQTGNVTIVR